MKFFHVIIIWGSGSMKFKKIVFCAGLISTTTISLLYVNRLDYENHVNKHTIYNSKHNANVIAHRGFSSLKLENSYKSVKIIAFV